MVRINLLFILILFTGYSANASIQNDTSIQTCTASNEYIATIGYLKSKTDFQLKDKDLYYTADKVSMGCSGASSRFINVTDFLVKVGIDTATAIEKGILFSQKDDAHTRTFMEIFKGTYRADTLDLDATNALSIALKLTGTIKVDTKRVIDDFNQLLSFCTHSKSLDLTPSYCANISAEAIETGNKYKSPIAKAFISLIEFIAFEKDGPQRDLTFAVNLARQTIKNGPLSATNFITGFKFATSKKGLDLDHSKAIEFGTKMAQRSTKSE